MIHYDDGVYRPLEEKEIEKIEKSCPSLILNVAEPLPSLPNVFAHEPSMEIRT